MGGEREDGEDGSVERGSVIHLRGDCVQLDVREMCCE